MSKHLFSSLFAALCALAFSSSPAVSQTIANSSFEVDASSGNGSGAITGWPFTAGSGGINNSTEPFADNGAIPDGQKVAFIRLGGTMHQVVSGFTLGLQHRLYYYENDQQHGHYWQFGELLRWRVASCLERVLEYQQFNNLRQFGRICGRGRYWL